MNSYRCWTNTFALAILLQLWTCATAFATTDYYKDVVLVKVGGSSITQKATKETLDHEALDWFASVIAMEISPYFLRQSAVAEEEEEEEEVVNDQVTTTCPHTTTLKNSTTAFVIVHGAGSFGHHTAKEFGLKGHLEPPPKSLETTIDNNDEEATITTASQRRRIMQGVSETRLSVQKLNQMVVTAFVQHGINAVAISPCFSIPNMQAHGGDATVKASLQSLIHSTLQAGLVPILHGDACLYGDTGGAGIISGDVLMEMVGEAQFISEAIFLTDVDGVFTKDPRIDPTARLLRRIQVNENLSFSLEDGAVVEASISAHDHDVTGGLKTKLASAISIASKGKNVTIAKSFSPSAEQAIRREPNISFATTIYIPAKTLV